MEQIVVFLVFLSNGEMTYLSAPIVYPTASMCEANIQYNIAQALSLDVFRVYLDLSPDEIERIIPVCVNQFQPII